MNNIPREIVKVTSDTVECVGTVDSRNEGHPRVWLRIPLTTGIVNCPYCEKTFTKNE